MATHRTEKGWTADELEQQYYIWLTNWVARWRMTHSMLLAKLYDTPFRVTLTMDENRVGDGLALRTRFIYDSGLTSTERDMLKICRPCSILEIMIALILRFEEEYAVNEQDEDPINARFGYMLNSLGLAADDDTTYMGDQNRVNLILLVFLDRAYHADGRGGLFYIPGAREDMRQIELWRQIMIWENYRT